MKISNETAAEIIRLYVIGFTTEVIATRLDIPQLAVRRVLVDAR